MENNENKNYKEKIVDALDTVETVVTAGVAKIKEGTVKSVEFVKENTAKGVEFVKVRQGYTKCSVCVVDENSAITSDRNIYNALISNGIDTLLISEGYIDLDGYDYGFIGGSCGKISKNEIAFTGRFNKHPDCDRILEFLNARKIDAKFLTDKDIFDIGSILPITEECEEIV